MEAETRGSMRLSETHPEDRWLREALDPAPGCCDRLVAQALCGQAEGGERGGLGRWRSAAAALLMLGLGGAIVLLTGRGEVPKTPSAVIEVKGGEPLLITNASGKVRLVSLPADPAMWTGEGASMARGEFATLVWNHGSVLAVKDSGGSSAVRISGGTP
jgi:hypothetical protein